MIISNISVDEIIKKATDRYPLSHSFCGRLSEEEILQIEDYCDIKCSSVYMNGTAQYVIRRKRENASR